MTNDSSEKACLVSMTEAAQYLGVTPRTVQNLMARDILRAVKIPGLRRTFLERKDLEKLVESAKGNAAEERRRGLSNSVGVSAEAHP